jgi:hypothetical protein
MAKGASAITQIQCLKLLTEGRFNVIYGILHGTFGETAQDYVEQQRLIPWITHLVPPAYFVKISLDRFSPYQLAPHSYGIENVRAAGPFKLIYPKPDIDHDNLARSFHYTFSEAPDTEVAAMLQAAIEQLRVAVEDWQKNYIPETLVYFQIDERTINVRDRRSGSESWTQLTPAERAVFCYCTEMRSRAQVSEALAGAVGQAELERAIDSLIERRFLLPHKQWLLTLPLQRRPKRVLGLTGWSCSGKTTLLDKFQQAGYRTFQVGTALIETVGYENYLLPPQEKLARFGKGESIFHLLADQLRQCLADCDLLVIDSLKAAQDQRVLQALLPDACIDAVLVAAADEVRLRRFILRKRPGDEPTLDEKDRKIADIGIQYVMDNAAYVIRDDRSPEDFDREFQLLLEALQKRHAADDLS